MLNVKFIIIFLIIAIGLNLHGQDLNAIQKKAVNYIDKHQELYSSVADSIWNYAELGFMEYKSADLLISVLEKNGFKVQKGIAGMPTAFKAEYGGEGSVIGLLAEFDALPGLTQSRLPQKKNVEGRVNGHGCGHNLLGTASIAAAISVKNQIEEGSVKGRVVVFGTPAEEGGSGKVYLARDGFFEDVDIVIHWHPSTENSINFNHSLANISAKFRFYGVSSHASSSPDKGKSALDGVEAMNYMTNMYREHAPLNSRIHYVITKGGEAPNVVPEFAEVYYYVRHKNPVEVKMMFERLVEIAEGAALGTGTTVDYEIIGGVHSILPVEKLARVLHRNLTQITFPELNEEEKSFVEQLSTSLSEQENIDFKYIVPFEMITDTKRSGSTDVGDVTWNVPTAGYRIMSYVPGTEGHSWQATACSGSVFGKRGMLIAAKAMSSATLELLYSPELIKEIRVEWKDMKGDYQYAPLIGDRKPALDYRR
jgi:aminobenzoyl-glutamate utilization protein B